MLNFQIIYKIVFKYLKPEKTSREAGSPDGGEEGQGRGAGEINDTGVVWKPFS